MLKLIVRTSPHMNVDLLSISTRISSRLDRMTDGAMTVSRLPDRNVRQVKWHDARQNYEAAL